MDGAILRPVTVMPTTPRYQDNEGGNEGSEGKPTTTGDDDNQKQKHASNDTDDYQQLNASHSIITNRDRTWTAEDLDTTLVKSASLSKSYDENYNEFKHQLTEEEKLKIRNETKDHWRGYFNDGWNVLDFIIVVSSLITLYESLDSTTSSGSSSSAAFTSLRAIRVLRPLRNVTHIAALRSVVYTFLRSLKNLASVGVLLFFLLAIFGILGVQLFNGRLRNRCFAETYTFSVECNNDTFDEYNYNISDCGIDNMINITINITDNDNYKDFESVIWTNITEDMNYFFCNPDDNICGHDSFAGPQYPQCLDIAPNPDKLAILIFFALFFVF